VVGGVCYCFFFFFFFLGGLGGKKKTKKKKKKTPHCRTRRTKASKPKPGQQHRVLSRLSKIKEVHDKSKAEEREREREIVYAHARKKKKQIVSMQNTPMSM